MAYELLVNKATEVNRVGIKFFILTSIVYNMKHPLRASQAFAYILELRSDFKGSTRSLRPLVTFDNLAGIALSI